MKAILGIWSLIGLVLYIWGCYVGSKYQNTDPMRGIHQMPGALMLVVALIWAFVVFFNWLLGLGLALAIGYGLYLVIRTDSQEVNDKNVLTGCLLTFAVATLVFFLM
jgi:hypothetical protein